MINMTKTFEARTTDFTNDYDVWFATMKLRGYYIVTVGGGQSAQDARGTCRGYWGFSVKKGWLERKSDDR